MAHGESTTAGSSAAPQRWSAPTIALHWLSAVLIFVLLGLGWFMVHGDVGAATKFDLYQLHKSLGFLSLALLLLRLGARFAKASPPLPAAMPDWERRLAGLTHVTFYLLLLVAALSGWLLVSAAIIAIPTRFFDLFVIPNLVGADAALQADMTFLHYVVSRLLIALAALHIAAALKHHFVDRDDIFARMLGLRRGR
jgi:cytochrome b561